jgi:hypothetical protein
VTPKQKLRDKKKWLFYIVIFLIPVVAISLSYLAYTAYRSTTFYNYVKSNQRGWSGKVWRADKELGFVNIPNSRGSETMPIGANVPTRIDKDGFRIPFEEKQRLINNNPVVLTLGCSFTYGAATQAKDTFPYLVGKYIGGSTKNAGVCSYGLSQMVLLANRLIPRHKPDYVIVQYSTWLVARAVRTFAPSYFGKIPNPYYAEKDNLIIMPPVFQTKVFDLPVDEYRNSQEGFADFLSFLWNVGLPLFLYDDFNIGVYTLASIFGLKDQPTTNYRAVIQYTYGEIHRVAEQNGAKMIIVLLGHNHQQVIVEKELLPDDVIVVDAQSALLKRLENIDRESYQRQYNHWRGEPPRRVDAHPNEIAHRIIAEEIASQIIESLNKSD